MPAKANFSNLFEDREGTIWVATNNGLDRFRDFAIATFSVNHGLPNSVVGSVLAARDGSVGLGTYGGLNKWNDGQFAIYGKRGAQAQGGAMPTTGNDGKLNGFNPHSLFPRIHWLLSAL
jgi:ligand-binding sensor domain-containing protein